MVETSGEHDSLKVSEMFYSIQGEGLTAGMPAAFLRLTACNLTCNAWGITGCDTTEVWKTGKRMTFDEIKTFYQDEGIYDRLFTPTVPHTLHTPHVNLVVTGGEPLLQRNQLAEFLKVTKPVYTEIETNGTIAPEHVANYMQDGKSHYTVSPKLDTAGDPEEKRFKPEVLEWFSKQPNAYFKFVIAFPWDVDQVIKKYLEPFNISRCRVFLMPEGTTSADVNTHSIAVVDACKKHGFRFSPRLHINIWEKTTGV